MAARSHDDASPLLRNDAMAEAGASPGSLALSTARPLRDNARQRANEVRPPDETWRSA